MIKRLFAIPRFTVFEVCLWLVSVSVMLIGFFIAPQNGVLNLIASLIGVTSLIFLARGAAFGQILMLVFSLMYGYISLGFRYYGEMATYVFMTAPMAAFSLVSWVKNPYKDTNEVKVSRLNGKNIAISLLLTVLVTFGFYFLLRALGTANLWVSTLSVTTSFIAAALTYLRSPYYALGYAANDVVLIVLWAFASLKELSALVMAACFVTFLVNDLYGFISWNRMAKRQKE